MKNVVKYKALKTLKTCRDWKRKKTFTSMVV